MSLIYFQNKKESKQSTQIQNQSVNEISTATHAWPHLTLSFLQPEKIKDIRMRTLKDPDYDQSTLHVPLDFLNNQTPVRSLLLLNIDLIYFCIDD